ncbi:hypothetical protein [Jannaschia sp. 2305UL9-9]|uniref:hypothetical protein n=1 Tax=Jannaschia sp. 2305UL9-9 TaxID=3121638 RepID=UPI0035288A22
MTAAKPVPSGRRVAILRAATVVALYLALSMMLASVPVEDLIDIVGSDNAYILMFALGTIGGFTTFTGIPYHFVLMSLAAGGLNPVWLGVSTAIGVMMGDSTMFLIGKQVKGSLPPRVLAIIDRLSMYLLHHPRLVTPALVAYGTVSPFSNDFVVASLSIGGYGYWRTVVPLTIGNVLYNIALAYLGLYAYDAIIGWF